MGTLLSDGGDSNDVPELNGVLLKLLMANILAGLCWVEVGAGSEMVTLGGILARASFFAEERDSFSWSIEFWLMVLCEKVEMELDFWL